MIVLGSLRGSPGVTTLALALAASDRAPTRLIVEADPSGGVLAARFGLGHDPGLLTLASTRRELEQAEFDEHTQAVDGGLRIVCGPATAEQSQAALTAGASGMAQRLRSRTEPVFVDVGRIDDRSPAMTLVDAARTVVVVARPRLEELQALGPRVDALRTRRAIVHVAIIGDRPYGADSISSMLDAPDVRVHAIADDRRAALALNAERPLGAHALRRSSLMRSAGVLLGALTRVVEPAS